jgi:hypothetical protein
MVVSGGGNIRIVRGAGRTAQRGGLVSILFRRLQRDQLGDSIVIDVGMDDTDMPGTPGTNQFARALAIRLVDRYRCAVIVRRL